MRRSGARAKEILERVKGIEPSYAAWEAAVLPLNYTRKVSDFTWVVSNTQITCQCQIEMSAWWVLVTPSCRVLLCLALTFAKGNSCLVRGLIPASIFFSNGDLRCHLLNFLLNLAL